MTKEAIIHKARAGVLRLECDYDRGFISALKRTIPPSERAWDPDSKCWLVTTDNLEILKELCKDYFEYVAERLD